VKKGRDYFNWFTEEQQKNWLRNFSNQFERDNGSLINIYDYYNSFMNREFPKYYIFFFLSFDIKYSIEGQDYWLNIYNEYVKYDNLVVRPGFSLTGSVKKPKIF
jgi:hypothetical protein